MSEPRAERPHMPDYGVGSVPWRPLSWSWAAERLVASTRYWLVTVRPDGRPHALPVWGVWDGPEDRFAFCCGPRSRKARNLAGDPRAVVTTEDAAECVSVEGEAAVVTEEARQELWIERYLLKYRPLAPELEAGFLRANLIVEFEPRQAFGIIDREDQFATRATRWVFAGP